VEFQPLCWYWQVDIGKQGRIGKKEVIVNLRRTFEIVGIFLFFSMLVVVEAAGQDQPLSAKEISLSLTPEMSTHLLLNSGQSADIDGTTVGAWETVFTENFDGVWPGSWVVFDQDNTNGDDTWSPVGCGPTPVSDPCMCWCAGSGDMTACGNYDHYQDSWMVYGPFSVVNYDNAEVLFSYMNESETDYDIFAWVASIDGSSFNGYYTNGTTAGYPTMWHNMEFDLTTVPTLGNLCGQPQVWIAFLFQSDLSNTMRGAYLDDVTIRRNVAATGPGEIHGFKWNDINGDGFWDKDVESPLGGWKIYLDPNENCQWDSEEPYYITDPNGAYHFTGLDPCTYIVAEVLEPNCPQTYPGDAAQSQSMKAGPSTWADDLSPAEKAKIAYMIQDSPPYPPKGIARSVVALDQIPQMAVMLSEVPTSTWTYGCSATSAGMLFGYYDRRGHTNMYTGPANGGVCPLTDLGQGDIPGSPISGACSIIATENGFDGRTTAGHVDDYWISYGSAGPDPWESGGTEHTWGGCTADYMGTNQWKWDSNVDGTVDFNVDGGTMCYCYTDGSKVYDYIPPSSWGTPQTELCHGMRLFAESRGYTVVENYNQLTDNQHASGFSFADYMSEIDAGRPVLLQVTGHTMVGVGYDQATQTVYLHDTWGNSVHTMIWGADYLGMYLQAVTVIQLEPVEEGCPGTHTVTVGPGQIIENVNFGNHCPVACGDWGYFRGDLNFDCYVNLKDLAILTLDWLLCSHPDDPECQLATP